MTKGPEGGVSAPMQEMIGKTFERWTVLAYSGTKGKSRAPHFLCVCQCGTEREVKKEYLTKGRSRSCGCLHRELVGNMFRTHGHSANRQVSKTYRAWAGMFMRCYLPNRKDYRWYGALGVVVCKRWRKFANFLDDMGICPEGLTLDR